MKRKDACLTTYGNSLIGDGVIDGDCGEPQIPTPIKLDAEDLKDITVEIHGFTFIDTGYCLACPICGKISGISCREDVDKKIDFFLKFGCEHYNRLDEPEGDNVDAGQAVGEDSE